MGREQRKKSPKGKLRHGKRFGIEDVKRFWDVLGAKATPTTVADAMKANGYQVSRSSVSRIANEQKWIAVAQEKQTADVIGAVPDADTAKQRMKSYIDELNSFTDEDVTTLAIRGQQMAVGAVYAALKAAVDETPGIAVAAADPIGKLLTGCAEALKLTVETQKMAYQMRIEASKDITPPAQPNGAVNGHAEHDRFAAADAAMGRALKNGGAQA